MKDRVRIAASIDPAPAAHLPLTMHLPRGTDFAAWRELALEALRAGLAPENLTWQVGDTVDDLFASGASGAVVASREASPAQRATRTGDAATEAGAESAKIETATPTRLAAGASRAGATADPRMPEEFRRLARRVICHRDPRRHAVLYRLWWRLLRTPRLLDDATDADLRQLHDWEREVARAAHKMKAFVRFRETDDGRFVAWFDPGHPLLEALAPFFARRFASMRWLIVTPDASCAWEDGRLHFGPGASRAAADGPRADPCEHLWRTYYASIFNPARLKVNAMVREMPRRYWRDLPEAALIPQLVARAAPRTGAMLVQGERAQAVPRLAAACRSLGEVAEAIAACRACPAGCQGTRAVAGEGPASARIVLVGEQPGDVEERGGRPFIGPAGAVLDEALGRAGLERDALYLTNAVKHFGFRQRGAMRLHKSPTRTIVEHCRWWVLREIELVRPAAVVALGRTAGAALGITPTWHPAYVLRQPDAAQRQRAMDELVAALAATTAAPRSPAPAPASPPASRAASSPSARPRE